MILDFICHFVVDIMNNNHYNVSIFSVLRKFLMQIHKKLVQFFLTHTMAQNNTD